MKPEAETTPPAWSPGAGEAAGVVQPHLGVGDGSAGSDGRPSVQHPMAVGPSVQDPMAVQDLAPQPKLLRIANKIGFQPGRQAGRCSALRPARASSPLPSREQLRLPKIIPPGIVLF